MELYGGAAGGAGAGAGGGATGTGAGYEQVVEGRAAWGISGLQPECEGSDDGECLFSEAVAGCAGVCAAEVGGGGGGEPGGLHGADDAEAVCGDGGPACGDGGAAASLEALLELASRDEAEGLGDAPWPPHFAKQEGEAKRVQPSKAKAFSDQIGEGFGAQRFRKRAVAKKTVEAGAESAESTSAEAKPKKTAARRVSKFPLIVIGQSQDKAAAMAGLERWKQAHPAAAALLAEDDVMVDRMRGSAYVWYRIRVNLRNVPEESGRWRWRRIRMMIRRGRGRMARRTCNAGRMR